MRDRGHSLASYLLRVSNRSATVPRLSIRAYSGAYTAENHVRRPGHTPNTPHAETDVYVLTLKTDAEHHERMAALRKRYFPPKLNKITSHVTLFHALPHSQLSKIQADIVDLLQWQRPFTIETTEPYLLGTQGVAVGVKSEAAKRVYRELSHRWHGFLSNQDMAFRPHYTLQNKVEDRSVVEATLEDLRQSFPGSKGEVSGLSLHKYDRGWWKNFKSWSFTPRGTPFPRRGKDIIWRQLDRGNSHERTQDSNDTSH